MDAFVANVALIGLVLVAGSLLSGTLERVGVPLVLAFLAIGALLGPFGLGLIDIGFHSAALHALATLGLVLVLFSDALTLQIANVRPHRWLLWRVLGPGTILPAAIVAAAAWLLLDLPLAHATILGAALASTDPVVLQPILRSRVLPPTARVALSIETGMNDIVLLPIVILTMLAVRPDVPGAVITRSVLGLFGLGPLLGALVGWLGILALSRVRARVGVRRDYESLYALGLAFSAYAAAEAVGGSGFVAAFVAGAVVALQDVELCDCFLEFGEVTAELFLLLTFVALGASVIWLGLSGIDWRLVLFACVALGARTAVLYPMLGRGHLMPNQDRRLVAVLGPRGLSSLLLILLPVFAGMAGSERLFAITAFVVLLSVVLHGGVIAWLVRRERRIEAPSIASAPIASALIAPAAPVMAVVPERITLDEMRDLQSRGEPVVVVDARARRNYDADTRIAAGAVRVEPDHAVRDATALRLSQHATLVIYCA